ncbi:MAG: hypothetical protein JJT94_07415 [Bernardetiaceae bacterium]|nr:hypothetical protein [Bernardetiaceae bacterium]
METQLTIGIISEGITDQALLRAIITGFLENPNVEFTPLQPKENESGNWDNVFKYCAHEEFQEAVSGYLDYIVVQIDTDFMRTGEVPPSYYIDISLESEVSQIVNLFREKLIELMGDTFYQAHKNKILFAISVHEIECWLLPIYYTAQKKARKITGCIDALNQVLPQKEGFYIKSKNYRHYQKMSKKFLKPKKLKAYSKQNESLELFYQEMQHKISF